MNITKLFTHIDPNDNCDTIYRVQDGETTTYVHELMWAGRMNTDSDEESDDIFNPSFKVLNPEGLRPQEAGRENDLRSFLEAVSKGKGDLHPLSQTQRGEKRRTAHWLRQKRRDR